MNLLNVNNLYIYENQFDLLLDYSIRPTSINIPLVQDIKEINTVKKLEKDQVPCSSTNNIYQNIQKETPKEKTWTIPFLLESPKVKNFNHLTLK